MNCNEYVATARKPVDMGDESRFEVPWKNKGGYCREALEYGACPGWLPTVFIEDREGLTAYYEDTGCLPLAEHCMGVLRRGESLLRFTLSVIRRLAEAERESDDFLLNRDGIRYCADCMFIRSGSGEIRLAYIPQEERRPFSQRIMELIRELERLFPKAGLKLLEDRLATELEERALGTKELLRLFSRWEREV